MTISIHHVALSVPDLEQSIAWYERVLGFQVERRFDVPRANARAAFLERDGTRVELFQVQDADPLPADRSHPHADLRTHGHKHVAFGARNYDELLQAMQDDGIDIVLRVGESFGRAFFICDNSGNVLEFVEE